MDWKKCPVSFTGTGFLGNEPAQYLYALIIFAAVLAALYLARKFVLVKLKTLAARTETDLDDMAVGLIHRITAFEYQLLAFYAATRRLARPASFDRLLHIAILLVFTWRAVTMLQELLSYWINRVAAGRGLGEAARASVTQSTQVILNTAVWVAAALFALANMGVNVSAFLTGLGIGGVAVALAAQAILGDLFNFFVILLDKPFIVGDFISAGAVEGTVEHIGLKSVRIRSLSGEMILVSNSRLLAAELKNYRCLRKRRVVLATKVAPDTPQAGLRQIPALLKAAVKSVEKTEFDRSTLAGIGDFSVNFETVYLVDSPDYGVYMNTQELVLLSVMEKLEKENIRLAYPRAVFGNDEGWKS